MISLLHLNQNQVLSEHHCTSLGTGLPASTSSTTKLLPDSAAVVGPSTLGSGALGTGTWGTSEERGDELSGVETGGLELALAPLDVSPLHQDSP